MEFYSDPSLPIETKKNKKDWDRVQTELIQLKAWRPEQVQQQVQAGK